MFCLPDVLFILFFIRKLVTACDTSKDLRTLSPWLVLFWWWCENKILILNLVASPLVVVQSVLCVELLEAQVLVRSLSWSNLIFTYENVHFVVLVDFKSVEV